MFCKNCGKQLDNDSRFCSECGTSLEKKINNEKDIDYMPKKEENKKEIESKSSASANERPFYKELLMISCYIISIFLTMLSFFALIMKFNFNNFVAFICFLTISLLSLPPLKDTINRKIYHIKTGMGIILIFILFIVGMNNMNKETDSEVIKNNSTNSSKLIAEKPKAKIIQKKIKISPKKQATIQKITLPRENLINIANAAGVATGNGIYCGFDSDEDLSTLAGKAIEGLAKNNKDRQEALEQYTISLAMSTPVGPNIAGETCQEYKSSYYKILQTLKNIRFYK